WFEGDEQKIFDTAFRNGTLQGAYLTMAARALGLDTGPMSGFDNADREFFAGTNNIKSNFLSNLGYGDGEKLFPRSPRLDCDEMAKMIIEEIPMKILALDTSMGACSVAVLRAGGAARGLFAREALMARGHAEALMPMMAEVVKEAGLDFGALDLVAATIGPGSFTGVR